MVKHCWLKFLLIVFLCAAFLSCTKENNNDVDRMTELTVCVNIPSTRTVYSPSTESALWESNASIGLIAKCDGSYTDGTFQKFVSISDYAAYAAHFKGQISDAEEHVNHEYVFYSVYPYAEEVTPLSPTFILPCVQHMDVTNDSWDPSCDFMIAKSGSYHGELVTQIHPEVSFKRLCGWLRLDFKDYLCSCSEDKVEYVMISSDKPMAGTFSIDFETQAMDKSTAVGTSIVCSFKGKGLKLKEVKPFFTMFPGEYENVEITITTEGAEENHIIRLPRANLSVSEGEIVTAKVTPKTGDSIVVDGTKGKTLPEKKGDDPICAIVFGHSFTMDATEYVPYLMQAAGISDFNLARFVRSNCSLKLFDEYVSYPENGSYSYWKTTPGSTKWTSKGKKPFQTILKEEPWDIIIFQQSIGFEGEGKYESFQPYLDNLIAFMTMESIRANNKRPIVGWHMFWSYNSGRLVDREVDSRKMYESIVDATTTMMSETGIRLVIPSGTAFQNARGTSLNDADAKMFLTDGAHAGLGVGRYIGAATWFESIIAPLYGKTVLGNTYLQPTQLPSESHMSTTLYWLPVNESNVTTLQKCAVEAVKHPFEVTHIEE